MCSIVAANPKLELKGPMLERTETPQLSANDKRGAY